MPQINANLTLNTAQAQATFNQFVRTINSSRIGQPLGRISGDAAEFNKSMQAATARVTAFGLSAGAIIQVKNAIIGAANATIEVDKQLIELNTFLGQSTSELGKFSKSLFQVAKNTAAPFSEAAGAAKEFARQGLSANEVLERTASALTLARISGLDFKDSVQGITTAINSFGKEALKATEITNKLIAVDTRFAVSSADLNEAIRRVGSSAEESGVGIDSLIAAVTAAQQTTGRGGAVIGNALKTIFTRLQRPEVLTQLEQLGVAVKDQNGFLLDGIGILKNFSDATKNLSQAERSRTAELIGGVYQINQLNALIKDLSSSNSVYANSLRISNLATDEAAKKNEELNKSMSSMLQSIKTTATEVASSFGSSFLRPIVEIGSMVSEGLLNKISPSEVGSKLGSELIKGLSGALGEGLSKTALPLLASIGGLLAVKLGSFGSSAFKELGKASTDIFTNKKDLELQKRINDVVARNPALITAIIAGKKTQAQAEAQILDFILKQNQQLRVQGSLSRSAFSNVMQAQKAAPRKKVFGIFADGYLPNFAMSAEQQEVATAKAYGAKNPVPRVIQATIKGKTQPVMVNSEEDVIPNFAGTGETAIIPRYRKMQDIPRMGSGHVPNFSWSKTNKMPKEFLAKYPESKAAIKAGRMYSPEVRAMLQKLQSGENIDRGLLEALIERDIPIREVAAPSSAKNLPSESLIRKALDKEQAKRVGKLSELSAGSSISVRQDVPSMTRKGVGVVKTLGPEGFKSYDSFVAFDNPVMNKSTALERASLAIGAGANKSPLLKISGTLSENQSLPKDLSSWTQVGFNPDRHSYYYDRKTKKPVVGGSKAIQIGNTVFVKDAISGKKEDFLYAGGHIPNFALSYKLPPEPFSAEIPENFIRLIHQTSAKNLGSIKRSGITFDKAKGIEGPRGIYADEKGFYGSPETRPSVEFAVDKNRFSYPPFVQGGDVKPSEIIAIHKPWHRHARYIENDPRVLKATLAGEHDDLTGDTGKAVRFIKRKYKNSNSSSIEAKASGYIPNFNHAKGRLPEGISGSMATFYDLNRKFGNLNIGKKVFKEQLPEDIKKQAIAREFLAARELLNLERSGLVSPIWKSPELIGTLQRSLERKSIGKEAMVGYKTQADLVDSLPNEFARNNLRSLFRLTNASLYDQVSTSQIGVRDLNPHNVMVNPQGQKIFTDIASSENFSKHQGKILFSQNSDSKTNLLLRRMARRGARLSVVDPGEFSLESPVLSREFAESLRDGRASGYIPNFTKRRDVIQRIGKKEIFARFQKHFEAGKDYQRFYEIHAEEYAKKGLSEEERRIHANITSAISPRLPDYVAAQFSGPIFNRFMETRSTNVDDYLDLPPAKKVSRHETLGGTGDMGRKGEIALSGKLRDRDDVRRYGLSKALKGFDLGSHDTAKTRHYARAILQDKTAFPIDTNVIQAILGGKTPTPNEAAKLISLANEFATLNKIETGASGLQAAIFKSNSKFAEQYTPDTVRSALSGIKGRAGGYVPNFAKILIAAKYYDALKVGKAKGVSISKTGDVQNVGREVFGGIGFSTSRIGKGYASAVRSTSPTTSLKKASEQAGVTKSIIIPVVASSAVNDPVPENLKTNEALLQQFLANHPQPKEVIASLSQQGFNVKSILNSHSGSEIKSIIDILSSDLFNKKILAKSADELKDPRLVKFFAPGGVKARGPKGTYAFGSSIASMQQGEYASKTPGKHKSYPILVTGKSGPKISKPINAEEIFPGITNNKDKLFFSSVYKFGTRILDTDNPEHMELLGRLGYSQQRLQQENLMAGGYIPNFALGRKHLNPDGKRHSRKLARSSEEISAMSKAFKSLNLERKNNKISIFKSEYSHWSGKNQSIGLKKPHRGLSSRAKQIEILAAYAHEMGHSSQLSGLERMRGVHSEIFNKHYTSAGVGEGYDREFELLREQDAWKEGLRFIPRQFQSAYKTQANRFYKTYSPDGKPMFDAFGAPGYASGYVPNFAGLGSSLLRSVRSTLERLKSGNVTVTDSKQLEDIYGKGYGRAGGLYDRELDEIILNKTVGTNSEFDTAHLMAHEGTHRVFTRLDRENNKKLSFEEQFLMATGQAENAGLRPPNQVRKKLADASIAFEDTASADVKNYFPSYGRVASFPESYNKSNYLEEMLADGSLDTIKGREMLSGPLGLSEKKLAQVNRIYRRLLSASMLGVSKKKSLRNLSYREPEVYDPAADANVPLLSSGYIPNFASTFNAEKIKQMGGHVGQANKASAPGLYNILNRIGIPIELDNITKKGLTDALSSKENKLKLYNFLKQEPIEITNYPDSYSEVKDGNHRFTLAQFAGIKNIPAKYKDNFSGGYIPNFSGLSDAVSREKTMSGLPASQIMAHFDGGGNPIAVTNKRDEPNGLKDVPNFAIPRSLLRLLSSRGSGLANPITGSAETFIGNVVVGILNQLAENEKVSTDVAAGAAAGFPAALGIKNILQAATSKKSSKVERLIAGATGLGQIGFGAFSGLSAKGELEKRINEKRYLEALDRSKASFQNLTENTGELADTFAKLESAYADPQADPKTIAKLAKKQEELLNKITFKNPDLIGKLASETNLGKRQTIIEESTKEAQRQESIREQSLKFLSQGKISGKDAPEKISDFFASIINSGNAELLNQNLSGAQPSDFANILKKGGLDVEEFSKIFQTDDLKKSFIEGLIVTQKLTQLSNEQASVVKELSKPLTEKKQKIEDTRAVRLAVSASLKEQLPELASFAGGFSRRAGISAASDAGLAITRSEASVAFNNSLMSELANSKFSDGLPADVRNRLLAIQSPSRQTGQELESLKTLPGLSKEQVAGIEKLIGFNSQQNRKLENANKIANETKNVQLKFLALQEKLAFGGDIRSSIDPEARAEAMSSAIRGPLTYQLGGLLGSRRTQIGGATDFLTDTIKKYPGLLQTKDGKEPADIQAVKRELTGLNAMDMQRDLLKRASMAEMMGLGQTGSMLRSKAFDRNYLLESAGLKTSALFGSPEVPEEVKKAMEEYEKFNVKGVREFKGEEKDLKNLEDQIAPIKQAITDKLTKEGSELAKAFKASLTETFGKTGIVTDIVNLSTRETVDKDAVNKNVENASKAYSGLGGLMPTGIPSNANGLTKYSSSIADAVKREKTALASRGIMGVPNFAMADINLERSPDLVNASNPFGFAVTNSIDEKNGLRSLGMRSSGFVPNYALFGDKVAAAGLAAAQSDKLYAFDKGTGGFHKVSPSGGIDYTTSFDYKSLPKDAKTISTELYSSPSDPKINTQKRGSNILGIKDPKVSKLNELQISTVPKSQLLDPILEKLYGAGKLSQADNLTPENLRDEVNKLTGGKRSLIKTAFGENNYAGRGVFGRKTDLGLPDYEEIIKRYKSGADSGFFAQTAVEGPYYGETRVHVAVDANGRVKLVKGGTINKLGTGVDSLSKEYVDTLMAENPGTTRKQMEELARRNKKASEAIAVRAAREFAKKFKIKNTIFGVDTLATTLESAQEAGATAKAFDAPDGRKMGAVVIELNPTDKIGSSGYMKGSAVQGLVNSVLGIENKPQGNAGNVLMGTQTPQASPRVTLPDEIPSGAGFNLERYLRSVRERQRMAERLASQDQIPDESTAQSTPRANRGLPPAPRPTSPGSNLIGTTQPSMPAGFAPRALPPLPRPTGPGSNLIGTTQPSMPAGFAPKGGEAPPIPGGTGGGLPPRDARGRFTARGGGTPTGGSGGPPPPSSYFGSMAFGSGDSGGGSPTAGSSTFLSKAKAAGAFGLKGLSVLFGAMQAKESYDQAKEGNYGKSTLAGLSSAASFAGLSKTAGKIAGPAGVALGALTDLESDLTLAKDFQDILGRKKETEYLGEDGKIKKQRDSIGIGDVVGTALGAAVSAPVTAAILGYRTGNVFENKLRLGDRLGDFASAVASGGRSLGLTSGPIRGMKSKEAYDSDQILTRKMELVKEINKYNRAAGNPEISVGENISKAKKAQERKDKADISALQEKLDKENKATRAGITARATAAGAAETGILNKKSTEEEEARRTKLRRSFIESFEKNGGADKFQTTKEKVEYFLSLERQLNQGSDPNGFGTFKPTDFKDPEFAKSFNTYTKSKEAEAAREAKRVFPKTSEEFKNRPPQQSFPDDVLREAVRTGRSAERVMQDREDEKIKRGLIPPIPLPSQTEIRNRPDPFTRDVLLEAARRRVPAEKIIQEREAATKEPLPLLPPALMGEIAIAGKSGSLIPGPLPSKIQGSEDFDPNKPDSYPADVVAEAIRTGRKPEQVIKDRAEGIQATDIPGGYSRGIIEEAMNRRGLTPVPQAPGLQNFPKDVLEEAMRRRVPAEQVMQERAGGAVPNFAAMSNSMMSSGDVYSRMRATSSRSSMSGYSGGHVPNFAAADFTNAISEAMKNGITSAFPNGGSSSSVSNSNVINIDGRTSIQNAPDEAMQGIIGILFDKFPELKKLGPSALNFKR